MTVNVCTCMYVCKCNVCKRVTEWKTGIREKVIDQIGRVMFLTKKTDKKI